MKRKPPTQYTDHALALIDKIQKGYVQKNGSIHWSKAFAEHPEWKTDLMKEFQIQQRLYAFVSERKRRNAPPKKQRIKIEEIPPTITANYCPNCGFNLRILTAAMSVAWKHTT